VSSGGPIAGSTAGSGAAGRGCGSEYTIPSDNANHIFPYHVSRRIQARYLTEAYRIAHRTPFIAGLGWIGLLDEPASVPDHGAIGLMTYEGEKKPAYLAYKRAR
jgi:hypothetical protein